MGTLWVFMGIYGLLTLRYESVKIRNKTCT